MFFYRNSKARLWKTEIVRLGDIATIMVPTLALAKTIYENDTRGIPYYFGNFVVVNLGTLVIQSLTHEEKPDGQSMKSFPSGHASAAFSGATYVHFRYSFGEAKWLYLMATFAAFSRVYGRNHYTHDVLASAAFSFLSSYLIVKNKSKDKIYTVDYEPNNKNLSIKFSYIF